MKTVIMVAGSFDPIQPGHYDHIKKAAALGDYLIVVVTPVKKNAGVVVREPYLDLKARMAAIIAIPVVDTVVKSIDDDGSVVRTLAWLKPHFFVKGGDRTADNMPAAEIEVCDINGIMVVYNQGWDALHHSSDIVKIMEGADKE